MPQQVYSGRKYTLLLGRQTDATPAVAMGTAQTDSTEFVELDVVSISDIDFTGGLVTDRTLRTGQQVKRFTDHYVSEKGSTKTFSFEWVCSHKEGIEILLELISDGDIVTPYTILGNHEAKTYANGETTGALATVVLKNLDSNKAAGQDRTMQDAALTSLTFRMDSGTSGGRLIASGTFMTGHTIDTASSSIDESSLGTQTAFVKTLYDCTTKTINSLACVVSSFEVTINNPCVRVGYDANGDAEAYSRAGEVTCVGSMNVLYDENSDAFLATTLQNPASGGSVVPILFADAAINSGDIGFSIPQAVLTSHNLTIEGAEEGMMVEVGFEGTADGSGQKLYEIDISPA